MLLRCLGIDEDVVEVDDDEGVEEGPEDVVHETLEGGRCIGEAKGKHRKFEVAVARPEGGLGDVRLVDAYLMVAGTEVDLGEDSKRPSFF